MMMRREAAVRAHRVGGLAVDEEHEDNDPNVHLRLRQHRPLLLGLLVRRDVLLHWVVLARLGIRLRRQRGREALELREQQLAGRIGRGQRLRDRVDERGHALRWARLHLPAQHRQQPHRIRYKALLTRGDVLLDQYERGVELCGVQRGELRTSRVAET